MLLIVLLTSERWSVVSARSSAARAAFSRALTTQGLVSSQLQKYRTLPLVLADYPNVQNALQARTPESIARLNARLELIADRTDAAEIYVVAADGLTVASRNWRLPTSFVGQNYGFRPYFTGAMRTGGAEQFALGTVSKRPGLYLAQRVTNGLGVVVVKVEFEPIEASLSHQSGPTVVRDGNGVVIMTNRPRWRLHSTRTLSASTNAAILRARLYGERGPSSLAPEMSIGTRDNVFSTDQTGRRYVAATLPIPVQGWSVTALEPLDPALQAASAEFRIIALAVALLILVVAGVAIRTREARQMRLAAQLELEREVAARTTELRTANEQLLRQSREREQNAERLRIAREELAQSNRLATLGQITAGVAHEINQPLAALRTFAESTLVLLERGRAADAVANIDRIVGLSGRISDITGELRLFARREGGKGPVALGTAIDGALLLVGDRARQAGITIGQAVTGSDSCMVASDRVRIEQILINLLQNAIDAVAGVADPHILISLAVSDATAIISIADNGAGISVKGQRDLFKSFVTKKAEGLGLGLVISRDLARAAGGELTHEPDEQWTTFRLCLPLA